MAANQPRGGLPIGVSGHELQLDASAVAKVTHTSDAVPLAGSGDREVVGARGLLLADELNLSESDEGFGSAVFR